MTNTQIETKKALLVSRDAMSNIGNSSEGKVNALRSCFDEYMVLTADKSHLLPLEDHSKRSPMHTKMTPYNYSIYCSEKTSLSGGKY